jgi:hypothetical protein
MYEIIKTKNALASGYWFIQEYYREWEKYCVVCPKSKLIFMTFQTKHSAENYKSFLLNKPTNLNQEAKTKIWRNYKS